jgi:phosphoglycolate phosphatase
MKKAILFDIDGTILNCHSAGKEAMLQAVEKTFGTIGLMKELDFQGKTDLLILKESLEPAGIAMTEITMKLSQLQNFYFELLVPLIKEKGILVHPGIPEMIKELSSSSNIALGLLTGNFETSGRLKVSEAHLNEYFDFGVFGDDTMIRNDMPFIAQRRIESLYGARISFEEMYIIGDTIHDIECAHNAGAKSICVGTGWANPADLKAADPNHYYDDFEDYKKVLSLFI